MARTRTTRTVGRIGRSSANGSEIDPKLAELDDAQRERVVARFRQGIKDNEKRQAYLRDLLKHPAATQAFDDAYEALGQSLYGGCAAVDADQVVTVLVLAEAMKALREKAGIYAEG